jgi:hypothetical protein
MEAMDLVLWRGMEGGDRGSHWRDVDSKNIELTSPLCVITRAPHIHSSHGIGQTNPSSASDHMTAST